jgi:hypothetical protein
MASDSSGSGEGWRVDDIFIVCERPTPTPTPFPTPSITPTPTASVTPTSTATPTPTETCRVTSAPCGTFSFPPPTDFTINLSCPIDFPFGGCGAGGLTVNNIPADSCTVLDLVTLTFHFNTSPAVPGPNNTIHLYPGTVSCCLQSVDEFTCTFLYKGPRFTPTPRPRPTPLPRPTPR